MASAWPFFELTIETPRLTLRMPRDEQLMSLADRACGNILGDQEHHFMDGWTELEPPQFQWQFMQFHWHARGTLSPDRWQLPFAIFPVDEEDPIGVMHLMAMDFRILRKASTASWLIRDYQGQGMGREARTAALHLAFAHLGAQEAESSATFDNPASSRVSLSLGYEANGIGPEERGDQKVEVQYYRLLRENWRRRSDITVKGLDGCLPLLGLKETR